MLHGHVFSKTTKNRSGRVLLHLRIPGTVPGGYPEYPDPLLKEAALQTVAVTSVCESGKNGAALCAGLGPRTWRRRAAYGSRRRGSRSLPGHLPGAPHGHVAAAPERRTQRAVCRTQRETTDSRSVSRRRRAARCGAQAATTFVSCKCVPAAASTWQSAAAVRSPLARSGRASCGLPRSFLLRLALACGRSAAAVPLLAPATRCQ